MTCNLEWKNQSNFLVKALNSLRQNDAFVDVTLAADGKHIKAHRLILCASSPYFKELLQDHSDKHSIIFLKDFTFSQLKLIVEYVYQGCVDIDHKELDKFIKAAKSLQISGLTENEESDNKTEPQEVTKEALVSHQKKRSCTDSPSRSPQEKKVKRKKNDLKKKENGIKEIFPELHENHLTLELELQTQEDINEEEDQDENIAHLLESTNGRFEPIEGRRKGSNFIGDIQEGFMYRIKRTENGKRYYRCSLNDKCPGRLVINRDGKIRILKDHDHPGDKHAVQNYKLVGACRSRAISEPTPVDQIIKEEVEKATGVSEVLVTSQYLLRARRDCLLQRRLKST